MTERVDHTYRSHGHYKEGTTQEDLERVPSGRTTIDEEAIRCAQVTMMAHMFWHTEDEEVRDTGHGVVNDTHDAHETSSPPRRLE